jgi:MYXO-CTERM domain-containing protein
MKATQGNYDDDSAFAGNWTGAKAAGVVRGAYHFFDPTLDGGAQAQYFLTAIGPLDAEDLSPMLDVECPTGPTDDCLGFSGGTGVTDAADFRARLLDWMTTVEYATGRKPMIYTYASFFAGTGVAGTGTNVDTTGFDAYPLWIASYSGTSCFDIPPPWTVAALWQNDDNGTFNGISGQVDVDRSIASLDELTGWPAIKHSSRADINGDGKADLCGRDPTGVVCALATGSGFGAPFAGPAWSDANGWTSPRYASTMQLADINGDGKADACGRADAGITCVLSTGSAFGTTITGPAWSDAAGWYLPQYYATVQFADVNGDGMSDVCGRGPLGVTCALATGTGFGTPFAGPAWSDAAGWNVPNRYRTIRFADIDGDGKADVCGRSSDGIHCAISSGTGFGASFSGPAWTDAVGWGTAAYASTIQLVDVDGDGKSDVCARAGAGITCALSTGTGFAPEFAGPAWSDTAGWGAPAYYATIVFPDLDGDGRSDVCGRSPTGMTCALSSGSAFGAPFAGPAWTDAVGWNQAHYYGTIGAGDVNGDGKDDLCARGAAGMTCAPSTGTSFGAEVTGPAWSDTTWGIAPYWATVATVGLAKRGGVLGDGGIAIDDGGTGVSLDGSLVPLDGSLSASAQASISGAASAACSCRTAKSEASPFGAPFAGLALALAVARRRRR